MEPAQAKGTLMDCEGCSELLADFLLDELPESEAVLVHEHLLICPACMKAYRDLKGTGKALEAVTSMQPVNGTEEFRAKVHAEAQVESEKIVAKLPPERRLRLEARREARQSIRMQAVKKPPPKVWSPGLLILALAGAAVMAAILLWPPQKDPSAARTPVGVLSVVLGKVEQFYVKANQPHTPVNEGKVVTPTDSYTTADLGRARIDVQEGGSIFMGPLCDVTLRSIPGEENDLVLQVENGEIGFLRPEIPTGGSSKYALWELRTEAGKLQIAPSTHAYARFSKHGKHAELEVSVLAGCVHAITKDEKKNEPLYAGQKTMLSDASSAVAVESLSDERPPAWRADLVSEADLAQLFGGKARILSRKPGNVQVELDYKFPLRGRDWHPEPEPEDSAMLERTLLSSQNGVMKCPPGIRLRHAAKFAPPLTYEVKLSADSRKDTSFAFAAMELPGVVVAVDVAREAVLSVQEKGKPPRRDRVAARTQATGAETLLLEVKPEGAGYAAVLNVPPGKTKPLALWKDRPDAPGDIWLYALADGILLDEIKITGILPADWLRMKWSGAQ